MLKINGVNIVTPATFKVDIFDLDAESARNTKGQLIRDRVTVKRKLSCEWSPLTMAEISVLLQAVQNVFFDVTYPDPMSGNLTETKTFYVGDRTMPLLRTDYQGQYLWEGLSMNFIEQ